MLKREVQTDGVYLKNVSGRRVRVRIIQESRYGGWDAVNLTTGRPIRVKSAQGLTKIQRAA